MNRLPISVTAHSGMLSKKPQSSIAFTILSGSVALPIFATPDAFIMVLITPWAMVNSASISSSP